MKKLIININRKDTVSHCITVTPTSLSGSVTKNQDYVGSSTVQFTLAVKNNCNSTLTLPSQILFTETGNGSTFKGRIEAHTLTANSTTNVNILFDGVYKTNNTSFSSSFTIGSTTVLVYLLVTVGDTVGSIGAIIKTKNNRQDHTFAVVDFTSVYSDPDGDSIVSVKLFGDISRIRLSGSAIVANQVIPISDVAAGKLTLIAPDTNDFASYSLSYSVIDSKGNTIT